MKNPIWKALFSIFVIVPLTVAIATMLWNGVLTQVVTIVDPINFWQMFKINNNTITHSYYIYIS